MLGLPVSCTSPVISSGSHPEFANDKASPHMKSMRRNHRTEDELLTPWTTVLVGVPLMALKMWREFGKTLVFSSRGQILRHRNITLPKCNALNISQNGASHVTYATYPMVTVTGNDGVLGQHGFGSLQRDYVGSSSKWPFLDHDSKEEVQNKHISFAS